MGKKIFNEDHPCFGKSCEGCETCMFDEPIPDRTLNILPRCNECGYLIKQYTGKYKGGSLDMEFNASCAKHMIISENIERARIIQRCVRGNESIYRPDWCPKVITATPEPVKLSLPAVINKPATYDDYIEKRNKMKELPSVMNWKDIKEGDMCVVPRILRQKRKLVLVKERTDYVLKCVELRDNLEPTSTYLNIYSNDIDVNFIVKIHKF
jgi:hypothetical protein